MLFSMKISYRNEDSPINLHSLNDENVILGEKALRNYHKMILESRRLKMTLIGNGLVGKTSLLLTHKNREFPAEVDYIANDFSFN